MPIDPSEAADIAREAGLTLSDARALAVMADSTDDAKAFAAKFAPSPEEIERAAADKAAAERAAAHKLAAELERGL